MCGKPRCMPALSQQCHNSVTIVHSEAWRCQSRGGSKEEEKGRDCHSCCPRRASHGNMFLSRLNTPGFFPVLIERNTRLRTKVANSKSVRARLHGGCAGGGGKGPKLYAFQETRAHDAQMPTCTNARTTHHARARTHTSARAHTHTYTHIHDGVDTNETLEGAPCALLLEFELRERLLDICFGSVAGARAGAACTERLIRQRVPPSEITHTHT